jgi:hypothetical protein
VGQGWSQEESQLANVQCKPVQNCHDGSLLYNGYIIIFKNLRFCDALQNILQLPYVSHSDVLIYESPHENSHTFFIALTPLHIPCTSLQSLTSLVIAYLSSLVLCHGCFHSQPFSSCSNIQSPNSTQVCKMRSTSMNFPGIY